MGTNELLRQPDRINVRWTNIPSSETYPIRHSFLCSWFIVTGLTRESVSCVIALCIYLSYLLISVLLPWHIWPIMKYMGDYPSKRFRQTTDLTDAIFEPALLHVSRRHQSRTGLQLSNCAIIRALYISGNRDSVWLNNLKRVLHKLPIYLLLEFDSVVILFHCVCLLRNLCETKFTVS